MKERLGITTNVISEVNMYSNDQSSKFKESKVS